MAATFGSMLLGASLCCLLLVLTKFGWLENRLGMSGGRASRRQDNGVRNSFVLLSFYLHALVWSFNEAPAGF